MHYLLFTLYNLVAVPLLYLGVRFAVLFNNKVARGVVGRRDLFEKLAQRLSAWPAEAPRIWFHISSMGEFEQARPVIQSVKTRRPDCRVLITFFSPSGYDHVQNYPTADYICYLPFDSLRQSRKFIRLVRPHAVVVIRHDIWPNFQWHLHRCAIPCYLIDASISEKRWRMLYGVRWAIRDVYRTFSEIHLISENNRQAFLQLYPYQDRLLVMGDTRYDQVFLRTCEPEKIAPLNDSGCFSRSRCFIAGSTWPSDEKIILPALLPFLKKQTDFRAIIAPHELSSDHLADLENVLNQYAISHIRHSRFALEQRGPWQVLLIDRMGILANLYALAELAFVGGSFGPGVHSVLEPAAHGCMVLFGPRYFNSLEAVALSQRKGGRCLHTTEDYTALLQTWLDDPQAIRSAGDQSRLLVQENLGAGERIVQRLLPQLPVVHARQTLF